MTDRRPAGQVRTTWRRLRRDPMSMIALGWLLLVAVLGLLAGLLSPYDPNEQSVGPVFATPSGDHWLGTDDLGRDLFSRMIAGAGLAMRFSLTVIAVVLVIAVPLGLIAGYLGGRTDNVIMRFMDAIMSFPALVLAIALVGALGPSLRNAMIAIIVAMIPSFARLVRGQALAVKEETFIEASRSIGTPARRIVARHVFPNVLSPLIVQAAVALGAVLLAEAGLSFLGLGQPPPEASWGSLLRRAYDYILVHPWQILPPGIAIALTILAFNTLGDGLRSALGAARAKGRRGTLGLTTVERPAADRESGKDAEDVGPAPLLSVEHLSLQFDTERGPTRVVDDVSFSIAPGETLGLVGESGSGKTVTSLSIMRLLASPPAKIVGGRIRFEGRDLLDLSIDEMAKVRGADIAMVFQDPMASLNPSLTVRHQISQVVRWHEGAGRRDADRRTDEVLEMVGVPKARASSYPHEFSGGMRQRAMIAMALACRPKLLLADEPTTALDVTIQAQVLELLKELRDELGMAMLFVTHDLGVVADICDRVAVMYAGQIVETAPVQELFHNPQHPYTEGLLKAVPQGGERRATLYTIPGQVPQFHELQAGCNLASRCPHVEDRCREGDVALRIAGTDHLSRCVRIGDVEIEPTELERA
jgi:peptide/nickel transport system permease protein